MSEWAKALGREVCSPASWRCDPRRVSASAKARGLEALSTPGGLGRYWAAQWLWISASGGAAQSASISIWVQGLRESTAYRSRSAIGRHNFRIHT